MPCCIVPGCRSNSLFTKLFSAPITNKLKWPLWCKYSPFLANIPVMKLQNARFCPLHFRPEYITENLTLTPDAVPTLYLDYKSAKKQIFYNRDNVHISRYKKWGLPIPSATDFKENLSQPLQEDSHIVDKHTPSPPDQNLLALPSDQDVPPSNTVSCNEEKTSTTEQNLLSLPADQEITATSKSVGSDDSKQPPAPEQNKRLSPSCQEVAPSENDTEFDIHLGSPLEPTPEPNLSLLQLDQNDTPCSTLVYSPEQTKQFNETIQSIQNSMCCVPGCNSKLQDRSCKLYRLPIHSAPLLAAWERACPFITSFSADLDQLKNIRICQRHFATVYMDRRKQLTADAVPTLNLRRGKPDGGNVSFISCSDDVVSTGCWSKPVPTRRNPQDDEIVKQCLLCSRHKNVDDEDSPVILSKFPLDRDLCRKWVKNVGIKKLARKSMNKLNSLFLCHDHFTPDCFNRKSLLITSYPTVKLPYPPLSEEDLKDFYVTIEQEENDLSDLDVEAIKQEIAHKKNSNNDNLQEFTRITPKIEYEQLSAIENATEYDEVHALFLSYAGTFRKLAPNLQTMLKLDLARIFARYELKNIPYLELRRKNKLNEPKISKTVRKTHTDKKPKKKKINTTTEVSLKPVALHETNRPLLKESSNIVPRGEPMEVRSSFSKPVLAQTQTRSVQKPVSAPKPSQSKPDGEVFTVMKYSDLPESLRKIIKAPRDDCQVAVPPYLLSETIIDAKEIVVANIGSKGPLKETLKRKAEVPALPPQVKTRNIRPVNILADDVVIPSEASDPLYIPPKVSKRETESADNESLSESKTTAGDGSVEDTEIMDDEIAYQDIEILEDNFDEDES